MSFFVDLLFSVVGHLCCYCVVDVFPVRFVVEFDRFCGFGL